MEMEFKNREDFRRWLQDNSQTGSGIWIAFSKAKNTSPSAAEALAEALCFGWIDGQIKPVNESRYLKYFAPRRPDSRWSEKNKKLVEELRASGLMTVHGEKAISVSRGKGTWDAPSEKPDFDQLLQDFSAVLGKFPEAGELFGRQCLSYKKQLAGFYFSAKQEETKRKRLEKIIAALESGTRGMLF
jgi:uncharacterized protein YdeI (YjbR/CyaY-like superfamily)